MKKKTTRILQHSFSFLCCCSAISPSSPQWSSSCVISILIHFDDDFYSSRKEGNDSRGLTREDLCTFNTLLLTADCRPTFHLISNAVHRSMSPSTCLYTFSVFQPHVKLFHAAFPWRENITRVCKSLKPFITRAWEMRTQKSRLIFHQVAGESSRWVTKKTTQVENNQRRRLAARCHTR